MTTPVLSGAVYEQLFHKIPLAVVAFDRTGRIHVANHAALELLQAPADTVERRLPIGMFLSIDPGDDPVPPIAYGPASTAPRLCVRLEELSEFVPQLRTVIVRPHASSSAALRPHVAMLGHELRNPLAPLRLAARHLREHGAEPAAACIAVERNVDQLSRIVNDLLDTQNATQGGLGIERAPIQFTDAITDAIDACAPQLTEAEHALEVDLDGLANVEIDGDRTRLAQAISNLLSNAATHAPRGSLIKLHGWLEGTEAHVTLTDDGPGLPERSLESIFETFARSAPPTHRRYGGLGLGLGLSRHIVELHCGRLSARSLGLGHGSTFVLELPGARMSTPQEPPPEQAAGQACTSSVLIVDDNEDAAAMLALVLESQGATCTVTHNGLSALTAAEATQFDLAIVDIGLPDIDGFEVARRAQVLETPPLRIVALSGYGQQSDRDTAQAAGFDAYYVKPMTPEVLATLLDSA